MIKKFLKLFGIFLIFILLAKFIYSQGWYQITITNSQSTATPAPFQQDIAICNGNPNIGSSFAYINNATLFNEINSNGSNVYFTTNLGSNPNIYSWYEGQDNINGVLCDVWWINLPNGIPANSNITIYMYIGNISDNYYQQYYPYVGEAPQLSSTYRQYDNGNYVFLFYDNFAGTSLSSNWINNGMSITVNNGVTLSPSGNVGSWSRNSITYNVNVYGMNYVAETYTKIISFGYDINPIMILNSNSNTAYSGSYDFVDDGIDLSSGPPPSYYHDTQTSQGFINRVSISMPSWYSYSNFNIYQIYVRGASVGVAVDYSNILNTQTDYNPSTQYLGIGSWGSNTIFVQWFRVRAYPPNGVMPSFSVVQLLTPTISVNTSTNFQFNVSIFDPYSEYVNYTVYLNGSILATNNVSVTVGQTLIIPYTYQYLFNQSGTYNLTVVAYGQSSGVTSIATNIFYIQLDQLNVSMSPIPYVYNNVNYTNLYNSNLNINYYCMRPNNTLIIYNNVTNQTLEFNLSCNYIETPENLFVNLTSILQNNTLNYINGSLLYGNQSFGSISFIPLWNTINITLTTNIPGISIYTSPISLSYYISERDVLPNVVCNITLYDNNTLVQTNSVTLTNASSATYSWTIPQTPIHNLRWYIFCNNSANLTYIINQTYGPFYYNRFDFKMEDTGNTPSNMPYSLSLMCSNSTTIYSNSNMNTYTLYLWTNDQCNFVLISQQIQGITFSMGYSTNLLSKYLFQWPICLINPSLYYVVNPLFGSFAYKDTLISVQNSQTGCYLLGSYLYLFSSNVYYAPIPVRIGALYSVRVDNVFVATFQGQQQQAISLDSLLAYTQNTTKQILQYNISYPTVNYTVINDNPTLIINAPMKISSAFIQIFQNDKPFLNYTFNSVGSNTLQVILKNLPNNFTFDSFNYAMITLKYENGYQETISYPPGLIKKNPLPAFLVYILSTMLLYVWTRTFSYYQKLIVAGFGLILLLLLVSTFIIESPAPIILTAGIFSFFILDVINKEYLSQITLDHPLYRIVGFVLKMAIVMSFASTLAAFIFGPYGLDIGIPQLKDYLNQMNDVTNDLGNTISQMMYNPFFFVVGLIKIAIAIIKAIWLGITGVGLLITLILQPFSLLFGPMATTIANVISTIVTISVAIIIVIFLAMLVFSAINLRPF